MKRRQLILGAAGGVVLLGGGAWLSVAAGTDPLTIASVRLRLEPLRAAAPATTGTWSLAQVLVHCAQSVEFSMTGFPEHKPALFKQTAGRLAFSAFSSKGRMSHGLDEAIPGAPALDEATPLASAADRLEAALADFERHTGPLQPHFAFGALSHADYAVAHAMHFNNHMAEVASE